jgi:hypothetical protein
MVFLNQRGLRAAGRSDLRRGCLLSKDRVVAQTLAFALDAISADRVTFVALFFKTNCALALLSTETAAGTIKKKKRQ